MAEVRELMFNGSLEDVRRWVDSGVDINFRYECGYTALHFAYKRPDITQLLIDNGAIVNSGTLTPFDCNGDVKDMTPLDFAIDIENLGTMRVLLANGADVNVSWAGTALHMAVWRPRLSSAKLLLERGIDINSKDSYGKTALDLAKKGDWRRTPESIELLEQYKKFTALGEWRPWRHSEYPLPYREAMKALVIIAKSYDYNRIN